MPCGFNTWTALKQYFLRAAAEMDVRCTGGNFPVRRDDRQAGMPGLCQKDGPVFTSASVPQIDAFEQHQR